MDPLTWMLGAAVVGAYGYRRPTDLFRVALRAHSAPLATAEADITRSRTPRLHYWRGGRGAPVVFVHGFGTEAAVNWYAQLIDASRPNGT